MKTKVSKSSIQVVMSAVFPIYLTDTQTLSDKVTVPLSSRHTILAEQVWLERLLV